MISIKSLTYKISEMLAVPHIGYSYRDPLGNLQIALGGSHSPAEALSNAKNMESTQKEVVTKSITYPVAYLGCTVTLGGCLALGNDMYSDLMNIVHSETAGNYNLIRGTVETGVKAAGVPKEYQAIFTDIGYYGVNTVLVGLGDWETIGDKLSNIKLPSLGQPQTEIEIAGI